jgi:hypothetical protein
MSGDATPARSLTQPDRCKPLARDQGCDEDEAAFDEALWKVAISPPQPKHEPKKRQPKDS